MKHRIIALLPLALMFVACVSKNQITTVEVVNKLNFDRNEIVEIDLNDIEIESSENEKIYINVYDKQKKEYITTQIVDANTDSIPDKLLFQAEVKALSKSYFKIEKAKATINIKNYKTTYSRLVPERIDDYTWENDKIAFRTYGPEAERLVKEGLAGGTLSSGIDLWLKKVDYSIIDKWYAMNTKEPGYYHIDHGEGYDPYHVGSSRGTGGTGIWENDSLHISDNFKTYKTICTGPLRTIFELNYNEWSKYNIKETKRISLDLGSNFTKIESTLKGDLPSNSYTVGITLHQGTGETEINKANGIFSHWELIDNINIGEGIIMHQNNVVEAFATNSKATDQNQLLILTNTQNKLTYHAGFAWVGSGQIKNKKDWKQMLTKQSEIIKNPLKANIVK